MIVIEHLEPVLSPWAWLEYKHAAGFARLVVTNVRSERERRCLAPFAEALPQSIAELAGRGEVLVLDPQASEPLAPEDFERFEYVVVGGIMGDFPPRGRTRKLLTEPLGAESRNLGPCQLSVDGAVYVASRVARGERLEDLEVAEGLILRSELVEVQLPYCYPWEQGRVVFSSELARYLLTLLEEDEAHAAREGTPRSIADYGCRLELPEVEYEVITGRVARIGELIEAARRKR